MNAPLVVSQDLSQPLGQGDTIPLDINGEGAVYVANGTYIEITPHKGRRRGIKTKAACGRSGVVEW